jgi:hypothetical protein
MMIIEIHRSFFLGLSVSTFCCFGFWLLRMPWASHGCYQRDVASTGVLLRCLVQHLFRALLTRLEAAFDSRVRDDNSLDYVKYVYFLGFGDILAKVYQLVECLLVDVDIVLKG